MGQGINAAGKSKGKWYHFTRQPSVNPGSADKRSVGDK
jgi:hypothetical protein